jgi:hypothetical protein
MSNFIVLAPHLGDVVKHLIGFRGDQGLWRHFGAGLAVPLGRGRALMICSHRLSRPS